MDMSLAKVSLGQEHGGRAGESPGEGVVGTGKKRSQNLNACHHQFEQVCDSVVGLIMSVHVTDEARYV